MKRHLIFTLAILAICVIQVSAQPSRDLAKKVEPAISKNQIFPGPKVVTPTRPPRPGEYFVVSYRCPSWQRYLGLTSDEARQIMPRLRAMGFAVKLTGTYEHAALYYQLPSWRERSFGSIADAQEFIRRLPPRGVEHTLQSRWR